MPNTTRTTAQPANGCITIQGPHGFVRLTPRCARQVAAALQRAASALDSGSPNVAIELEGGLQPADAADSVKVPACPGGAA